MRFNVLVTQEAMSLFATPRPCPECGRPLPEPFEDNYQHWEGCSVGEGERAAPAPTVEEGGRE
jgi:hypothetical protein